MFYVYSLHIKSGKTECVQRTFATAEDAIRHIAYCYSADKEIRQLGEYYYFMREV